MEYIRKRRMLLLVIDNQDKKLNDFIRQRKCKSVKCMGAIITF